MSSIEQNNAILWRGMEDIYELEENIRLKLPQHASIWPELQSETSRRTFLKLMGASLAMAGISSCTKLPAEKIFPYPLAGQSRLDSESLKFASSASFLTSHRRMS